MSYPFNQSLFELLQKTGTYLGSLAEHISKEKMQNLQEVWEKTLLGLDPQQDKGSCFYSYEQRKTLHTEEEWDPYNGVISLEEIPARDALVAQHSYIVTQKWYVSNSENKKEVLKFLDLMSLDLISQFYPSRQFTIGNDNKTRGDITLYEPGNFIDMHKDGENEGRLCAVLIYLNPQEKYLGGGELVVIDKQRKRSVMAPLLGNFCILDFLSSNLSHGVRPIQPGWHRYAYLSFVNYKRTNKLI